MNRALTGATVRKLMRENGKTITGLAATMNITQVRVRYVRERGVSGECFVRDWLEAIARKPLNSEPPRCITVLQ